MYNTIRIPVVYGREIRTNPEIVVYDEYGERDNFCDRFEAKGKYQHKDRSRLRYYDSDLTRKIFGTLGSLLAHRTEVSRIRSGVEFKVFPAHFGTAIDKGYRGIRQPNEYAEDPHYEGCHCWEIQEKSKVIVKITWRSGALTVTLFDEGAEDWFAKFHCPSKGSARETLKHLLTYFYDLGWANYVKYYSDPYYGKHLNRVLDAHLDWIWTK